VRIDGKFRGEIASDDVLILGERADVDAKIEVGSLIVLGGTLRGEVRATRAVELHAPAKVYGSITAPQLVIDRGVQFEGQSKLSDEAATPPEVPQAGPAPEGEGKHKSPLPAGEG
jgi:cytoskeletal protein CcmA (bactofilin family)